MPRRKARLRATQCAVRCSGVPIAVLNRSSIRNRHECPSIVQVSIGTEGSGVSFASDERLYVLDVIPVIAQAGLDRRVQD